MTAKTVVGILAHVDAGKTTLAEGILYTTGSIRKIGRVDHGDTFLDTNVMEKERGITVFSKQAKVTLKEQGGREFILLDTPGHVDFSAEMERTLQVLDMALLLISGADGVQGHVETLWKLLKRYEIPTILFVNKMDQPGTDESRLMDELCEKLSENCINFSNRDDEALAMCSEEMMESFLEVGNVGDDLIYKAIAERKLYPVFFGSALKMEGVDELLAGLSKYAPVKEYPNEFGARVYKIERDKNGMRLTHVKITGGSFRVKGLFHEEKADQIRVYSGDNYQLADEVYAGDICTLVGPEKTYAGQGVGYESEGVTPSLIPVLNYQVNFPEGCDTFKAMQMLRTVEEEIPELHVEWIPQTARVYVQVMGQVQMEILSRIFLDRFGMEISFGRGRILYKETIEEAVKGTGHYEPLRHYAEVSLALVPGERGSGISIESICSEDDLDKNWQRLIFTNIAEKKHLGVLTGSEITDLRIILLGGRAHNKHTEGGDFRQATYRAIRQGLMQARTILLEPFYEFSISVPKENIGRVMSDMQRKSGSFSEPDMQGEMCILKGKAPVAELNEYQQELLSFTKGRGRITLNFLDYEPCHDAASVVEDISYEPEKDLENTADSVFCAHGAGFVVPWREVPSFAHVDTTDLFAKLTGKPKLVKEETQVESFAAKADTGERAERVISQEEIEQIFIQSYGRKPLDKNPWNRPAPKPQIVTPKMPEYKYKPKKQEESYLLVDGYNIINAWPELKELLDTNADSARNKLIDELCNYAGCIKSTVIVVFDAYRVKPNAGEIFKYQNIYVVYTKEAETADEYIEKTVHAMGRKYQVTVATSDGLEQIIIWGQGAQRLSALGLKEEIKRVTKEAYEGFQGQKENEKFYPLKEALEGLDGHLQEN